MKPRIAFFDTKPYDEEYFQKANVDYGCAIKFFPNRLTVDTTPLTHGFDAVCVFVNDLITPPIVEGLVQNGIRLIALRSAGYNNVDLKAVYRRIHVVRVPAYSPYAVAEHAVALMLTLENPQGLFQDARQQLHVKRAHGFRHVREDCRCDRHRPHRPEGDRHPQRIRHAHCGL